MPTCGTAHDAYDVNDELRVTRASYSQPCLNESNSQPSIVGPQQPARTYHNKGVQTLPPPNGDIFKLIYGREPLQIDYVRNMGIAAIGRYGNDPGSNVYEPIYGASYSALPAMQVKANTNSGFQTADCNTIRSALVRAKAKASLTAKKYRAIASQAGFTISAESKNHMIVHSEQLLTTVRLNAEGNLLEGTIDKLYLPNILGTPLQPQSSMSMSQDVSAILKGQVSDLAEHHSRIKLPESPSHSVSLRSCASTPQEGLTEPPAQISALAPSLREHTQDLSLVFEDEYGNVGSFSNEFVIFDAGNDSALSTPTTFVSSPRKRRIGEPQHIDSPSKRARISSPAPRRPAACTARSPSLPNRSPRPGRKMPRTPSPSGSNHMTLVSQSAQTRPGNSQVVGCERILAANRLDFTGASKSDRTLTTNGSASKKRRYLKHENLEMAYGEHLKYGIDPAHCAGQNLAHDLPESHIARNLHTPKKLRLDQDRLQDDPAHIKDPSSERNMFPGLFLARARASGLETVRKPRLNSRSQRDNVSTSVYNLEVADDNDDVAMHGAKGSHISTVQSASNIMARGDDTTSSRAEKNLTSRISSKHRQAITPYVPPAMRAKALQTRNVRHTQQERCRK
ncbi:hypothetical protein SVAN01_02163 [Stagonosporopsis vannaccii]|nr:hypothetical protein SVAN01_02163 [Stagonosporopsis vannaccii]